MQSSSGAKLWGVSAAARIGGKRRAKHAAFEMQNGVFFILLMACADSEKVVHLVGARTISVEENVICSKVNAPYVQLAKGEQYVETLDPQQIIAVWDTLPVVHGGKVQFFCRNPSAINAGQ